MKIWLDDIREPPTEGWKWVKTVAEAKEELIDFPEVDEVSLDHDLGENQPTGYDLIKWLERGTMEVGWNFPKIRVHSANPVGRKNIEAAVKRIKEYLTERSRNGKEER